jgi:hypothetical protein
MNISEKMNFENNFLANVLVQCILNKQTWLYIKIGLHFAQYSALDRSMVFSDLRQVGGFQ